MSTLSPADVRALDQLRQRLSQLTSSIATLQRDLQSFETLPPWHHLTSSLSIISSNLSAVAAAQSNHASLLSALAVYPLPSYPGRTEEGLLNQLLRKKLEPGVEDWVEQGHSAGLALSGSAKPKAAVVAGDDPMDETESSGPSAEDLKELWSWAPAAGNAQARQQVFFQDYTVAEVEGGVDNVVTGLRRKLKAKLKRAGEDEDEEESSEEDDEDEDEDENMEDGDDAVVEVRRKSTGLPGVELDILKPHKEGGRQMPLNEQWKFMLTGQKS